MRYLYFVSPVLSWSHSQTACRKHVLIFSFNDTLNNSQTHESSTITNVDQGRYISGVCHALVMRLRAEPCYFQIKGLQTRSLRWKTPQFSLWYVSEQKIEMDLGRYF